MGGVEQGDRERRRLEATGLTASCWPWGLSQAPAPALLGLKDIGAGGHVLSVQGAMSTRVYTCQPSHPTRWWQVTAKMGIFLDRKTAGCVCWGGRLAHHAGQGSQGTRDPAGVLKGELFLAAGHLMG